MNVYNHNVRCPCIDCTNGVSKYDLELSRLIIIYIARQVKVK